MLGHTVKVVFKYVHEIEKLNDQMTSYISIIIAGNRNASQLKKTNKYKSIIFRSAIEWKILSNDGCAQ